MIVETMEVVLSGPPIEGPRRLLLSRKDNPFFVVFRTLVSPDVPVAEERAPIGARRFEPWTVNRCVVHDEIDDHSDPQRVGPFHELDELAGRSVLLMDGVVVCDVIAVITKGRLVEGLEP